MPGKRNLARERAQHAATARARTAALYAMLCQTLPDHERALVGQLPILRYLHDTLRIRRPNGQPLKWRIVLRWFHTQGFPLVRGGWHVGRSAKQASLTTTHAVTAWVLTRFDTATDRAGFSVSIPADAADDGNAPDDSDASKGLGMIPAQPAARAA